MMQSSCVYLIRSHEVLQNQQTPLRNFSFSCMIPLRHNVIDDQTLSRNFGYTKIMEAMEIANTTGARELNSGTAWLDTGISAALVPISCIVCMQIGRASCRERV